MFVSHTAVWWLSFLHQPDQTRGNLWKDYTSTWCSHWHTAVQELRPKAGSERWKRFQLNGTRTTKPRWKSGMGWSNSFSCFLFTNVPPISSYLHWDKVILKTWFSLVRGSGVDGGRLTFGKWNKTSVAFPARGNSILNAVLQIPVCYRFCWKQARNRGESARLDGLIRWSMKICKESSSVSPRCNVLMHTRTTVLKKKK